MIPFNKPFLTGKETDYIKQAVESGKISGDGMFTKKCHNFFEETYGFKKALLTTSCTDALEMAAILLDIKEGDEVIAPAYAFVSTVNAFVLRGAKIVFADSHADEPNIDATKLEALITPKTKVIVLVHYAGVACDMDAIMALAKKHNLYVVEDAAQGIDSFYKGRALGSIGHLAAFSFHETKNIICGEGGMLAINDEKFIRRAEIIREKGTNRSQYFRGEIEKYEWVDIGSSFLPSEISAAFLYAQIENLQAIQTRRKQLWNNYYQQLEVLQQAGKFSLPVIPEYATNNGHIFYIVCNSAEERTILTAHMQGKGIYAVFHYLSLQQSPFYAAKHDGRTLPNTDRFSTCLLRLPLYYELTDAQQGEVCRALREFYASSQDSN